MLVNGWLAIITEDVDQAQHWFAEALGSSRDIDVRAFESSALAGLANVAVTRGQLDEARTLFRNGVVAGWDGDFPLVLVKNLMGIVHISASHGEFMRAARLSGAIDSFGDVFRAAPMAIRRRYESVLPELRQTLGNDRFETEHQRGMTLHLADMVAEALAEDGGSSASSDTHDVG